MRIKYVGKNVDFTIAMEEYTRKKLSHLEKYFVIDRNTEARVLARTYPKHLKKIEITIPTRHGVLRSERTADDYYKAVDLAIDALEDQIRRMKTKLVERHKESLAETFIKEENEESTSIVREKEIILEEMDPDEAVLQSSLSDHSFYLFKDSDTGNPAVVYKRKDGNFGLIEGKQNAHII